MYLLILIASAAVAFADLAHPIAATDPNAAMGQNAHHGVEANNNAGHGTASGHEAASSHGAHHVPSQTVRTASYLLVAFMVVNFVILWLVNWPDPNIRKYTWEMMSSTISIYLAVLLNNAVRDLWLWIIMGHRAAHNVLQVREELLIRLTLFLLTFAMANVFPYVCHALKLRPSWLFAAQTLTGHLLAFAGIELYKTLLAEHGNHIFMWVSFGFVLLSMAVFRISTRVFRDFFFGPLEGRSVLKYGHAETPEWREAVCEAEDDGVSIFQSYVVQCVVLVNLFGFGYHHKINDHTGGDLGNIALALFCFALVLISATYLRKLTDRRFVDANHVHTSFYARFWTSVSVMVAMTMSWLGLTLFYWAVMSMYPGISHRFDELISAGFITASAIVGIIILDCFADRVSEDGPEFQKKMQKITGSSPLAAQAAEAAQANARALLHGTGINENVDEALLQVQDMKNLEKAIRVLINSFALAVGLSWEKAFHAALEVVIETTPHLSKHFVASQWGLALLNCLVIMPVWLKFIVPKAKKSVSGHLKMIQVAQEPDL